ncbi:hypothetical protein DDB_G0283417 [Dictyostelium discoideum AX4]|uniref:Probable dual specificity protein phosphatase DDB_G0283417 n=1 Tax=Dictyostelium discoideum TaxID=44689 RepID=DUSP2_DICDI|nr:hypothetical protein DDB_G0283417 [Dictyostelium discoideum AX4]Q54R42.1 RecName: Full=Probable dual specificity protein phosphatase DDB_G0283417 [Dictyostelium discoideum]EAL65693.1 hypothetical protein DDB_G0283417 [Dictyostelium discoideum AX4]|eukprot:XP_639049.1 hypothetical protein DDB_G0283417 [Dictyostelium discoideum AX4]
MVNLEELSLKRNNMKRTETTFTDISGKRYQVANINEENSESNRIELNRTSGFVIDTKPDDLSHKIEIIIPQSILNNNNNNYESINLYIGSQDAAFNKLDLQLKNIKSILNVGIGINNLFTKENSDINDGFIINYCNVEIFDDVNFNIIEKFDKCFEFIDSNIGGVENNGILVHCNAGVSRSATILISYLMKKLKIPLSLSLEILKSSRPQCKPNQGFLKQLEIFEKELLF